MKVKLKRVIPLPLVNGSMLRRLWLQAKEHSHQAASSINIPSLTPTSKPAFLKLAVLTLILCMITTVVFMNVSKHSEKMKQPEHAYEATNWFAPLTLSVTHSYN